MAGALSVMTAMGGGSIITDGLQLWLDPALAASYPGSGTSAYDLSPNHYTVTLVNGVTYSPTPGSFGFNGATNYRYINTGQSLSSETFTLSSWFKSSTTALYQMLFSKETTAGVPWNYRLYLNQTTGYVTGDIAKTGPNSKGVSNLNNLCDGVWHNVVFCRSVALDRLDLYVDGSLSTSATDTTTGAMVNSQNVWIGLSAFTGSSPTGSYPVNGQIGQSLIYNTALTATQVLANFNAMRGVYGV